MQADAPSQDLPTATPPRKLTAQCCIAGGGPAGMMLGYLLARSGIDTIVLEKHADFLRDFRGDTVHPSTMRIMDELGLLEAFLRRPHDRIFTFDGVFGETRVRVADLRKLDVKAPYIAFMPQWEFLNFLAEEGARLPKLRVMMQAEVTDLTREGERITGVAVHLPEGPVTIAAALTIGCDGRHSTVRVRAGLSIEEIGAPIDVLWFRVGKGANDSDQLFARFGAGHMIVTIDRGSYWQCAFVIPKGQVETIKARGLPAFKQTVTTLAPVLDAHIDDVKDWDDVKLLTVAIDRLRHWSKPGLLCIGDAAHAMSPVGGVGINLAVQDAVATANLLSEALAKGTPNEETLDSVRQRRLLPTRLTQAMQVIVQNQLIAPTLASQNRQIKPPLMLRIINHSPWLQGLAARLVGLGVRPEHVLTKAAP